MLCLLGNCQAEALAATSCLRSAGPLKFFYLHRAEILDGPGLPEQKAELRNYLGERETAALLLSGRLGLQPSLADLRACAPTAFVVTLFHESPVLLARSGDRLLKLDNGLAASLPPQFQDWVRAGFDPADNDAGTAAYFARLLGLLRVLRRNFPEAPILLVKRLSPAPAFGRHCYSYLSCWHEAWKVAGPLLGRFTAEVPGTSVLDLDLLLADLRRVRPQAAPPFVRRMVEFFPARDQLRIIGWQDIEHLRQEVWEDVAEVVLQRLSGQAATLHTGAQPPEWDGMSPAFPLPSEEEICAGLISGDNMLASGALAELALRPQLDLAATLGRHYATLAVNISTLTELKHLVILRPTPELLAILEDLLVLHDRSATAGGGVLDTDMTLLRALRNLVAVMADGPQGLGRIRSCSLDGPTEVAEECLRWLAAQGVTPARSVQDVPAAEDAYHLHFGNLDLAPAGGRLVDGAHLWNSIRNALPGGSTLEF